MVSRGELEVLDNADYDKNFGGKWEKQVYKLL